MDYAHEWTEGEIKELEKRIRAEFTQAEREIEQKLRDHLDHFRNNEAVWKRKVKDGKATEKEYQDWRMGQIAVGKRWEALRSEIARDFANASEIARSMTRERAIGVYATNHSFSTYQIEQQARVDTSYTLYDRSAVERLMRDNPKVMHDPGKAKSERIRMGLEQKWNERQIQSVMVQGILQGESIPRLAERLARTVGDKDMNAAIRNARTAMTGAQNAGRIDSYRRANDLGIKVRKCWIATHDGRTRHWHAELDGQTAEVDEPFVNEYGEIMYPGDPGAEPANIYNCRCTLVSQVKGRETDVMGYRKDSGEGYKSYGDWLKEHGKERGWYKADSANRKTEQEKQKTFYEKVAQSQERAKKEGLTEEVLKEAGGYLAEEFEKAKADSDRNVGETKKVVMALLKRTNEIENDIKIADQVALGFMEPGVGNAYKTAQEARLESKRLFKEIQKIESSEEYIKAHNDYYAALEGQAKVKRPGWLRDKIGEVREVGTEGIDLSKHLMGKTGSDASKAVQWAYGNYPKQWVEKSIAYGQIDPVKSGRGYYKTGTNGKPAEMAVSDPKMAVATHEVGHRFEEVLRDILKCEKEYYDRRTQGEKLERLRDLKKGGKYKISEVTKKDKFIDAYIGKWYNGRVYELVSMGFQYAYHDPDLLASDPDMQKWIYGLLLLAE